MGGVQPDDFTWFTEAVEAFSVAQLPLEVEPAAGDRVRAAVATGGALLVGERHGVEQNPLVAYTLMHRFDVRILCLEWPADLEPAVERYLAWGRLDASSLRRRPRDDRITAGHFAVLRALAQEARLDRVVLFDPPVWPDTWSERDQNMAARLLAALGGFPAVVMAGNLHTRLRRHRQGEPMGAHVARARPGTREVRLRYPGAGRFPWTGGNATGCRLRVAGAWLELTVPGAGPAVTPERRPAVARPAGP
jgi:hypothetical protein